MENERAARPRTSRKTYLAILLILMLPLTGTLVAQKATSDAIDKQNLARFNTLVLENEKALLTRVTSYEQTLIGAAGLITTSEFVSRREWRDYVQVTSVRERFPGINGIGYIANVADENLADFLKEIRSDGVPDFTVKPAKNSPANFIIKYIEPLDINLPALGLNIAFEENRRAAATLAAKSGLPVITKRILLVQDAEKTPGFLLLYPIYEPGAQIDTPAARLAHNIGWVYAPFIGKNFLHELTLSQGISLHLEVYDGTDPSPDTLIYDGGELLTDRTARAPLFSATKSIDIMQQPWTLEWKSTASFDASVTDYQPEMVLVAGLVLTAFLGLLLLMAVRRSEVVQVEVARKTREIIDTQNNLQAVLDTVVDGIVSISEKGIIKAFNPSAERIFGYAAEEVIGKNVKILMPEPFQSEHDGYLQNYLATGEEKVIGIGRTVSAQRKDGTVFPMELAVNQMSLETERGFVGSIRDITEREVAREALEASAQTFKQVMEQASVGMVLVSPSGKWLRINNAICELLGYSEEQLRNMDIQELSHPDDLDIDLENMGALIAGKADTYLLEKRFIAKKRNVVWASVSASLVRKPDGSPDYFIKQVTDITDRKKMDRVKSEFVSTVSHELRTPLTSIRGSLGLIVGAMTEGLPDKVVELLTIAHNNSERLINLVNDILDIDKLDSGQMHFEVKREKLAPLLQQAIESNGAYAENFDVHLQLDPISPELEMDIDPFRISQVLANLISNAAKFSPGGTEVTVFAKKFDGVVRVSVSDKGVGIADEFRDQIFTKFAQADSSSTRENSGTGLGLLISKQMIEQMGGQIGFDSLPGRGSTFWFQFPEVSTNTSDAEPTDSEPEYGSSKPKIKEVS